MSYGESQSAGERTFAAPAPRRRVPCQVRATAA